MQLDIQLLRENVTLANKAYEIAAAQLWHAHRVELAERKANGTTEPIEGSPYRLAYLDALAHSRHMLARAEVVQSALDDALGTV